MTERFLCNLDEIPDGGARIVGMAHVDPSVILVRRAAQVWAYANRCPHFSVRLDFDPGHVPTWRARFLMCAHHGALFRFEDGYCIDGPCAGARLDALPVRVDSVTRAVWFCKWKMET